MRSSSVLCTSNQTRCLQLVNAHAILQESILTAFRASSSVAEKEAISVVGMSAMKPTVSTYMTFIMLSKTPATAAEIPANGTNIHVWTENTVTMGLNFNETAICTSWFTGSLQVRAGAYLHDW